MERVQALQNDNSEAEVRRAEVEGQLRQSHGVSSFKIAQNRELQKSSEIFKTFLKNNVASLFEVLMHLSLSNQ